MAHCMGVWSWYSQILLKCPRDNTALVQAGFLSAVVSLLLYSSRCPTLSQGMGWSMASALMERNLIPKRRYSVLALSFYFVLKPQAFSPRRDLNGLTVIIPICYMRHALKSLTHLLLTDILQNTWDRSHFIGEKFEA